MTIEDVLERAGLTAAELKGGSLPVRSPIDGAEIARIRETPAADMPAILERSHKVPRLAGGSGAKARRIRAAVGRGIARFERGSGRLVTLEAGKISRKASAKCRR